MRRGSRPCWRRRRADAASRVAAARARSICSGRSALAISSRLAAASLSPVLRPARAICRFPQALLHADTLGRKDAQIELAVLDAESAAFTNHPRRRLVRLPVGADRIQHGEVMHRACVAVRPPSGPLACLGEVPGHPDDLLIHVADAVSRRREAEFGGHFDNARPWTCPAWRRHRRVAEPISNNALASPAAAASRSGRDRHHQARRSRRRRHSLGWRHDR